MGREGRADMGEKRKGIVWRRIARRARCSGELVLGATDSQECLSLVCTR